MYGSSTAFSETQEKYYCLFVCEVNKNKWRVMHFMNL